MYEKQQGLFDNNIGEPQIAINASEVENTVIGHFEWLFETWTNERVKVIWAGYMNRDQACPGSIFIKSASLEPGKGCRVKLNFDVKGTLKRWGMRTVDVCKGEVPMDLRVTIKVASILLKPDYVKFLGEVFRDKFAEMLIANEN